ncbi:MAG: efflux RND transporter permease subunit [Mariniphaga sp.]|nr:efflux RND transporter permease subunit [Mariniphaga sp.]
MVHFLIHRPVAVIMAFLAFVLIGLVTSVTLPVSLMPDIDIPVVSVRISSTDLPARQLENTVVGPLRNVLKEVNNVETMKSETRDGTAWVELRFRHGTPIDLASVEVNEKVDKVMNYIPREMRRPEVIRASASDIPVFYLIVTQKTDELPKTPGTAGQDDDLPFHDESIKGTGLLPLSNFTSQVIRKRLEQLPEIALVDMSGLQFPEIKITPRPEYLQSGAFSISRLEEALRENNIDLGNLLIRDGQYQYNIRFNTRLRDVNDIENIHVNLNGKVVPLIDLAIIEMQPQQPQGSVRFNSDDAVSLAIIKQSDARMAGLKKELDRMVSYFRKDYPELAFSVTRDQTRLLEYSINNLGQSLFIGGFLAFLSLFLFLRERRAPWLIGVSVPVSLVITLLFFYLAGLSINIISLSGLVLGVGMMIDNSIIVIDNITQHHQRISSNPSNFQTLKLSNSSNSSNNLKLLSLSCVNGTNEVIRPLISSVLTTCAVFIPLIFMKGMAGALFFDQAVAVSIGLVVSLIVSITLLPTLYRLIYQGKNKQTVRKEAPPLYFHWYEAGLKFTLRHRIISVTIIVLMLLSTPVLWFLMPVSQFPEVSHDEILLEIDWNEPVSLDENRARTSGLLATLGSEAEYVIEEAGRQQYLLRSGDEAGISENRLYIKARSPEALEELIHELTEKLKTGYPEAGFSFSETENLFNLAFGKAEDPLVARFIHFHPGGNNYLNELAVLQETAEAEFGEQVRSQLITRRLVLLETDPGKLLFYQVDHNDLYREVKSAFNVNTVFTINDNNMYIPVSIGNRFQTVYDIVREVTVKNRQGESIPLSGLVSVSNGSGLKTIVAGKDGEYFPVMLDVSPRELQNVTTRMKAIAANQEGFDVSFGGSVLSNRAMLKELLLIVSISLLLLYFILAAQFESFILPLIVLVEVPIDLFGVFLMLKLFGSDINIMSAIGIIVMAGVVINDSILKVDTINKLMAGGYSLLRSIFEGGRRRLKPIIMTSLTTILAILPFLFQRGMGAELQKPLGLAIIGGMLAGTVVSLFLIPLMYYLLKRKPAERRSNEKGE